MDDLTPDVFEQNAVLASIPPEELASLRPHLRTIELAREQQIYGPHEPIRDLYFPLHGMISIVAQMGSGDTAEVGVIGRESMTGLPVYEGARNLAFRVAVQIPGRAAVLEIDRWLAAQTRNPLVRVATERATHALLALVAQLAACNRTHDVEQRLARWLLGAKDAAATEPLELTQEYLSMMVGVQRPTVTLAAGTFQRDGLIEYRRGKIRIKDGDALLARACECYESVRSEQTRLVGNGQARHAGDGLLTSTGGGHGGRAEVRAS